MPCVMRSIGLAECPTIHGLPNTTHDTCLVDVVPLEPVVGEAVHRHVPALRVHQPYLLILCWF